jgi:hypothetical protein
MAAQLVAAWLPAIRLTVVEEAEENNIDKGELIGFHTGSQACVASVSVKSVKSV